LQKLKIIPKNIDPITVDLTDSPPPSPRVKRERGIHGFGQERDEHRAKDTIIKREPGVDHSSSQIPGQTPARLAPGDEPRTPLGSATNERGKKRKALEDELKVIELEQKRLRLTQALAEMESSD
jgi:hypothetical protein